ncbi:MAG: PQQ-binding-like beta-propeller repeat protein [Kiritimatiellae bacterium]|nr:PQQ-binding-like beta-propeller repeat protein [Kiritimatiellia bacterium]
MLQNITLTTVLFSVLIHNVHANDWPCWRGPDHNGISQETEWNPSALKNGVTKQWSINVGKGFSSVSVKDGKVITLGNKNNRDIVYCLDAKTGKEMWRFSYQCQAAKYPGPRSSPAIDGDSVYTLSREGHLFCFDLNSGKVKWRQNIVSSLNAKLPHWGLSPSPVIEGDLLLIQVGSHCAALDKKTGKKIWTSPPGKAAYSSPVVFSKGSKKYIATFSIKSINGIDLKTGHKVWSHPWKTKYDVNAADPIIDKNRLFISSGYGRGCALIDISQATPKIIWENKTLSTHTNGGILLNGFIYGFNGDIRKISPLTCIDIKTGKPVWTQKMGGIGSLIAADNKLIILNERGKLFVVQASAKEYKELANGQVIENDKCWTAPVLANGSVFCRGSKGTLVCVNMKN